MPNNQLELQPPQPTCQEVTLQLLHIQRHLPSTLTGIQEVRHSSCCCSRPHCRCIVHAPAAGWHVANAHKHGLGLYVARVRVGSRQRMQLARCQC